MRMSPAKVIRLLGVFNMCAFYANVIAILILANFHSRSAMTIWFAFFAASLGFHMAFVNLIKCKILISYNLNKQCLKGLCFRQGVFFARRPNEVVIRKDSIDRVREIRRPFSQRCLLTYVRYEGSDFIVGDAQLRADIEENWKDVNSGSISFFGYIVPSCALAIIVVMLLFWLLYWYFIS